MDRFEEVFWSGQSLEELYRSLSEPRRPPGSPRCSSPPCASGSAPSRARAARSQSLAQRIDKVLDVTIQREVERLEARLLVLASIGSAGPYIGLFGTVWGIMNSFTSIAASKNTSLAVVAPGIAEALFATAIGLFAAIPAVLAYNKLQAEVAKLQSRLEGFADEFSAILSRQIDERIGARGLRGSRAMAIASAGLAHGTAARRRRRRGRRSGAINEINMTPFIDVMLVLLIIFMVAAPLMTAGVPLDLPQTKAAPLNVDAKPVTLSIKADGPGLSGRGRIDGRRDRAAVDGERRSRASTSASSCAATSASITGASPR